MSHAEAQLPNATGRELPLSRLEWKLFIPEGYTPPARDRVNVLVHFHGHPQTVWNNAAYAGVEAVVVTVNYNGLSSAYRKPFTDRALFQTLLDKVQATLGEQPGFENPKIDTLAVSSFSAGYGAVRELLKTPAYFDAIDAILAADSLYASTGEDGTPVDSQMADYKRFAKLAVAGKKRFIFTHSRVPTPTYESTEETGDELLAHLKLTAQPTQQKGLGPLRFYREAHRGGFHFWGAQGDDGESHMAHLRYMAEWLGELEADSAKESSLD